MQINFIRHGMTAGNSRGAYIGSTDEPLCEEGIRAAEEAAPMIRSLTGRDAAAACGRRILIVSPMCRCRQTAAILFPEEPQRIITDFRECDFGAFEGKNADELTKDPAFQTWIDTNGQGAFPGGDDPAQFKERCCRAFAALVRDCEEDDDLTIAAHGGVIMAILERYALPYQEFYKWHIGNVQGYAAKWDGVHLTAVKRI